MWKIFTFWCMSLSVHSPLLLVWTIYYQILSSYTMNLIIFSGAPKIVSNAQQYAAEGSSGKLECKARAVPYPDTIEWTRNNEVITYEGSGKYFEKQETNYDVVTSTLTITNTVESDFGQYNCTIVNFRGSDMLTINLIAKGIYTYSFNTSEFSNSPKWDVFQRI